MRMQDVCVFCVLMEFTRGILVFGINWFNNAALALWICASRAHIQFVPQHARMQPNKIEYIIYICIFSIDTYRIG